MPDREAVINLIIKKMAQPNIEPHSFVEKTTFAKLKEYCTVGRVINFDDHFQDEESAIKAACTYILDHRDMFPDEAHMIYNAACSEDNGILQILRETDSNERWKEKLKQAYLIVKA